MPITIGSFFSAVRKSMAGHTNAAREERARLEEMRVQKQALEAERQAEWNRRNTDEAIAEAAEAKRLRNEANYAVWQAAAKEKRRKRR